MSPAIRGVVLHSLFLLCVVLTIPLFLRAQATEKVLYTFTGQHDVAWPSAGLTFDRQGDLYGTSSSFGPHGYGTVFQLTPSASGWTEKIIHAFCPDYPGCPDGAFPLAGVVFDAAGNLYGTTSGGGGPNAWGTVFQLTPSGGSWKETVLCSLSCLGDSYPAAAVTLDSAGRIFGTAAGNPTFGALGAVFALAPNPSRDWKHRLLYVFQSSYMGSHPSTSLLIDKAHNLYGMTGIGGVNDGGVVFQLSPVAGGQWSYKAILNFPFVLGGTLGGLTFDAAGNIFGTAQGMVFELTPSGDTWTETVLYTFADGEGGRLSRVVFDRAGNLFGTAGNGGLPGCQNGYGCGSVFKLTQTKNRWQKSTLYQFTGGADGGNPTGVVLDQAGNLYGVTTVGGKTGSCAHLGCGVAFEIIP